MDDRHSDDQFLSELFDEQPQAVVWLIPVFGNSSQHITDFEVRYCNEEALKFIAVSREQAQGMLMSELPAVTKAMYSRFFSDTIKVYQTGRRMESYDYNPILEKHGKLLRSRVRGGVLLVIQDLTKEHQLFRELEREKAFSEAILNATIHCVFTYGAVRDEHGAVTDLRYLYLNKQAEELVRRSSKDALGHTLLEFYPQAAENGLLELGRKILKTGRPSRMEVYFDRDGLYGWHDISGTLMDEDTILMSCINITLQKEAALETERQKTLLNNILKYSPAGISVIKVIRDEQQTVIDGKTIIINDIASQYMGMSVKELKERTFKEKYPTIFNSPLYQTIVSALQTGISFRTQQFFEKVGKWMEFSVSKLDDDRLILVFIDITPIKTTQAHLEKSLEELRRSNVNLEDFAHAASHDLKEPIRKILTFAERLKTSLAAYMNESERQTFERMENAALRMRQLVEDLLQFSHVSHHPRPKEWVNLNDKLRNVQSDIELLIADKGARITVGPLPTIKGNKRQMQQLFYNLLTNALKYSKAGQPPEIAITASVVHGRDVPIHLVSEDRQKQFHLIEVRDNGIGFEPQYAERIFHMFQRLHGRSEYPGTGLGLTIARKVVENHGGYIWARSEPGQGATFYVLLPVETEKASRPSNGNRNGHQRPKDNNDSPSS